MKYFLAICICFTSLHATAEDIKKVSGLDLGIQTYKWVGKTIETNANCLYADRNEFRCIAGRARIDFQKILPEEEQSNVENICDTMAKAFSKKCRFTIHFVYDHFLPMDNGGIFGKTTVIIAKDNIGTIVRR